MRLLGERKVSSFPHSKSDSKYSQLNKRRSDTELNFYCIIFEIPLHFIPMREFYAIFHTVLLQEPFATMLPMAFQDLNFQHREVNFSSVSSVRVHPPTES